MSIGIRTWLAAIILVVFATPSPASDEWSLSYSLEAEGNYSRAIEVLNPIIREDPEHEFAILRIAWLRYLNRDYNAAIRDYRRALEINEQSLDAKLGVALSLLAQGRWNPCSRSRHGIITRICDSSRRRRGRRTGMRSPSAPGRFPPAIRRTRRPSCIWRGRKQGAVILARPLQPIVACSTGCRAI